MSEEYGSGTVAVIGAGPAGLFAARELAAQGVKVVLFNKNIKPGGLAEYGIYPDKLRIKDGLRSQFKQILSCENITYFGNVAIGDKYPIGIEELRKMGFAAILITCGAQGTKWLGLPGEELAGVYHAKTIVFHYNHLPPFSTQKIKIGKKVVVVGVGNVMTDIVRYLSGYAGVEEITTIARRGPAEVKFDNRELEPVVAYLDEDGFEREIKRVAPAMQAIGQSPEIATQNIHTVLAGGVEKKGSPVWRMRFLYSPIKMISRDGKTVSALEVEENVLELRNGEPKARGTGRTHEFEADTIIFAIGDRVDDELGLPLQGNEFVKTPTPKFPIDSNSYELLDTQSPERLDGVFVGGWSRNASTGMVGAARKDGVSAARAVLAFLTERSKFQTVSLTEVASRLRSSGYLFVSMDSLAKLEEAEKAQAIKMNRPEFKFDSDEEMLKIMGLR